MDRQQIIDMISEKIKLIRVEAGYTQDKMAEILGISKKTLVQIEKGRIEAGWTTVIAVCALFRDSDIIRSILGEDPIETIETIAHDGIDRRKEKTLGGKVWWRVVERKGDFILQQNLISQHYRIIDSDYYRYFSSFDEQSARNRLKELAGEK
jgi:DNA-binding XRE family transcriptional regulator